MKCDSCDKPLVDGVALEITDVAANTATSVSVCNPCYTLLTKRLGQSLDDGAAVSVRLYPDGAVEPLDDKKRTWN